MRPAGSISFRLGSGAVAASLGDTTIDWAGTTEASLPKLERSPLTFADSAFLPSPEKNHPPNPIYQKLKQNIDKLFGIAIAVILFYMMPRLAADRSDFNYRIPPSWSPRNDQH